MNKGGKKRSGVLEVITGPMFSGKTEELLRRLNRAIIAKQPVQLFNHALDVRYGKKSIVSHNGLSMKADSVSRAGDLVKRVHPQTRIVAIDEAQYFGPGLVDAVHTLLGRGHDVIMSGLCLTRDGEPFEPMPSFMAEAEKLLKLNAICMQCGTDTPFHKRIIRSHRKMKRYDPALVGGTDSYMALCRTCRK